MLTASDEDTKYSWRPLYVVKVLEATVLLRTGYVSVIKKTRNAWRTLVGKCVEKSATLKTNKCIDGRMV
jgi:hypothetical protein